MFRNLIILLLQEIIASLAQEGELKSKFFIHNHFKEKQKERRGSDSDLVRNNKKYSDNCGVIFDEKKRRLSQVEQIEHDQPSVVGSTNVGTITGLPQKPRKDKVKIRDVFKKDLSKTKNFCKLAGDKVQSKVVSLPVAGDMNMEAKFKQGLLEGNVEKNVVVRSHHRTDVSNALSENNRMETTDKVILLFFISVYFMYTKMFSKLYIFRKIKTLAIYKKLFESLLLYWL